MNGILIERYPGAAREVINAQALNRIDSLIRNDHEHTDVTEYALDGRIVHRSAHITLKQWPAGMENFLAEVSKGRGIMPTDMDPAAPAMRHLNALKRMRGHDIRFANTQAMTTAFKVDVMNGLHAFGASVVRGATTKDAYKAALYLASATRGAADTVYNSTGEVSGTGYSAGGVAVTTGTAPTSSGTTSFFTPSASIVYTTVTLSTAFDAMLFYNDTSASKLAVAVFTFGSQTITAGNFTLTMPVNDATNGLIRIA